MHSITTIATTCVRVRDFPVLADVGINPDEIGRRQPLIISVEVTIEAGKKPTHIDGTVDYRRIVEAIEALSVIHVPLIEAFGEHLSQTFLGWSNVAAVRVLIDKPFALARGMAGVEVSARRQSNNVSSSLKPFDLDASEDSCACRSQGVGFAEAGS